MIQLYILIIILLIASYTDLKYRKIPNWLTFPGMALGFIVGSHTPEIILWKLLCLCILFILGMSRLVGFGDLKLIMVINSFLTILPAIYCTGIAAGLLVLYSFIRNRKETWGIFKITLSQLFYQNVEKMDQKGYPFAPFLLVGTCIYSFYVFHGFHIF